MIDKPGSSVLYRSASGLERSMADADAERLLATYAEAVIDVWDPYKIDLDLLPYLAWAMGVNFWVDQWKENTKRGWVARQMEFKSLRGTLGGVKMALDFAGRDVSPFGYSLLGATTPPQKVFSGPSLTAAQREEWLETLPQLRVYLVQEAGAAGARKAFLGGHSGVRLRDPRFCLGGQPDGVYAYGTPSTALSRLRRKARYIVDGAEQDVTIDSLGSYWQLHLPSQAGRKVFCDVPVAEKFYIPSDAWKRILTVAPDTTQPWRSMVGPTLTPISVKPDRIAEAGTRGKSVFCDAPLGPGHYSFFMPSTAANRIYSRYAIFDASKPPPRGVAPCQFMGVGRYGFPKYTAWLRVSIGSKRSPWAVGEGINDHKFYVPHNPQPLINVRETVQASLRMADKVMLDIGPERRFVAGGKPLMAGVDTLIVGQP